MVMVFRSTATNSWSPRTSMSPQVIRSSASNEWSTKSEPSYVSRVHSTASSNWQSRPYPIQTHVIRSAVYAVQPPTYYGSAAYAVQPPTYHAVGSAAYAIQPCSYRVVRSAVYDLQPASYRTERLQPASYRSEAAHLATAQAIAAEENTIIHNHTDVSVDKNVANLEHWDNNIPEPSSSDNDDAYSAASYDLECTPPTPTASATRAPAVLRLFSSHSDQTTATSVSDENCSTRQSTIHNRI